MNGLGGCELSDSDSKPKLAPQQEKEVVAMISSGQKTGADAARLFRVHPATVTRVMVKARAGLGMPG